MMKKEYIITCDAGTTGVKITVFDRRGTAVCSTSREYETIYPKPNWAEQNPKAVLSQVLQGLKEILTQVKPSDIACIGLSGTMNGMIPVDERGEALYNNIIHSDSRSLREVETIRSIISEEAFYALTGNRLDHHFTLPKILWLKRNLPSVYRKMKWCLNTKDYIYGYLTGNVGVTDYSDASLTIAMDIKKRTWASELLRDIGIEPGIMPALKKGYDVTGRITGAVAKETGLIQGTPVAVGGGDGACAGRGAGIAAAGASYCYIGSSAWVSRMTNSAVLDPDRRILNMYDLDGESVHVFGVIQCAAAAYNWAMKNLILGPDAEPISGAEFSRFENMARQIEPGSEGVLFLPTLMSERTPYWDASTRGCLFGFSLYHDRRHIVRAVYEGVAFALFGIVKIFNDLNMPMNQMMLTGGGARSGLWPDILASVFDMDTQVHLSPGESTSLGAAMAAGVGVGIYKDFEEASRIIRTRSVHTPNPAWAARYRDVFGLYERMYDRLKPLFDGVADIF